MFMKMKGAFGIVEELISDETKVVKKQRLFEDFFIFPQALKECSLLKLMDHPRIIKATNISASLGGDIVEIVMPKYTTLSKTKINDYKKFIMQSLEGLIYLHDNDIVHGDIKPANMVTDGDNYYFIDFGSSKIGEEMYENVTTKKYQSPESFYEFSTSKKSDVWSLGIFFNDYTEGYDFLIEKMFALDMNERPTARECYKMISPDEPEIKISHKKIRYNENPQNIKVLKLVRSIIREEKMQSTIYYRFVALYEHFTSIFKVEDELIPIILALLSICYLIFQPNASTDVKIISGFFAGAISSSELRKAIFKILVTLNFNLQFILENPEDVEPIPEFLYMNSMAIGLTKIQENGKRYIIGNHFRNDVERIHSRLENCSNIVKLVKVDDNSIYYEDQAYCLRYHLELFSSNIERHFNDILNILIDLHSINFINIITAENLFINFEGKISVAFIQTTMKFMAPESVKSKIFTKESDVFCVGQILFLILSKGRDLYNYKALDMTDISKIGFKKYIERYFEIDSKYLQLIEEMTDVDPKLRPNAKSCLEKFIDIKNAQN